MRKYQALKYTMILVIGVSLLAVVAGIQVKSQEINYTSGTTLPLCSYEIPQSTYQDLGLDFNYHYYDDPDLSSSGDINRGSVFGDHSYMYLNPNYSLNLNSTAYLSLSSGEITYDASNSASYNAYLAGTNAFAYGGLQTSLSSSYSESLGLRVVTGSGFGRFRNVTPLVKATLIGRTLFRRRIIDGSLPDRLTDNIAKVIGRPNPETSLDEVVTRVINLIESSEALNVDQLGAVEVLRVREIIESGSEQKLCGWEIKAGIGYEAFDPMGGPRDFLVDAGARLALPFSTHSQLNLEADFSSTFDLTRSFTVSTNANYTYRFARNLDTKFQYTFRYQGGDVSLYHHNFSATVQAEVSRNLATQMTVGLSDSTNYEEVATEVTVGLFYDLI